METIFHKVQLYAPLNSTRREREPPEADNIADFSLRVLCNSRGRILKRAGK